jgi:glutaredoxin 3
MLILYMRSTCPFCQRTMQMAENLGVTLDLRDIDESEEALAELLEKGGKQQVPYLVDTDKSIAMFESGDIIEYLRENYAKSGSSDSPKPRVHVGGSTCTSCEG